MPNIDYARVLTTQDKAAQALAAHTAKAKAACKCRILARFPLEAQQNLAHAITVYTAGIVRGDSVDDIRAGSGLSDDDFEVARTARHWVAAMQAACRAASADLAADLEAESLWPALPEGVAALVSRF